MTIIRITVTPREAGAPPHELDEHVAGEYCYGAEDTEAALDRFHETVPIKVLDDFVIEAEEVEAETPRSTIWDWLAEWPGIRA